MSALTTFGVNSSDIDVAMRLTPGVIGSAFSGAMNSVPDVSFGVIEETPIILAPIAGVPMTIASTNAADTSIIRITALGPNGSFVQPFDIQLTGTTPISIGTFSRINYLSRITGDLTGQVRIQNSGNLHGFIQPGGQIMRSARFCIPAGYRFQVESLLASMTKDAGAEASITFNLQYKPMTSSVFGTVFGFATQRSGSSNANYHQDFGGATTGPFDIQIVGQASVSGLPVQVYCSGPLINSAMYP